MLQLAKRSQAIRQRVNYEIEQNDVNETDKDKKERSFADMIAEGTFSHDNEKAVRKRIGKHLKETKRTV